MTPAEIREMKRFIDEHRPPTTSFDIIVEGTTPGGNHTRVVKKVRPFARGRDLVAGKHDDVFLG
jgi:hypothetical protein